MTDQDFSHQSDMRVKANELIESAFWIMREHFIRVGEAPAKYVDWLQRRNEYIRNIDSDVPGGVNAK